ncbi:hypothetical protein ColTof4_05964 [Colletotrichum tofieldiae]|nr:hypothetical protein ColTof3_01142 [Colletotrichum tofieldiae]GKT73541.1 hypothetical protein ColTof4_05964 [Colletotrichum tofieldiae]
MDASTKTNSGWLPRCVTYYKDIRRNNWIWYLGCEQDRHSGTTDIVLVAETAETFGASQDVTSMSASETLLISTISSVPSPSTPPETFSQDSSASSGLQDDADISPATQPNSSSSTPAIIGGVIGGVAVVMIGVCVVVWLLVRRKRASRAKEAPMPSPGPVQDAKTTPYPDAAAQQDPQQPHHAGYEERYKYQSVSTASPISHEVYPASPRTTAVSRNSVVELG